MIKPEIQEAIDKKAAEHEIDPALVSSFVMVESSGNPKATRYEPAFYNKYISPMNLPEVEGKSRATSFGLMQIMGQVARELGFKGEFTDLFIPEVGLDYSLKHLKKFIERYKGKGIDYAISSYNAGSPRFNSSGEFVNQGYVDMIHKYLIEIKEG
jgi:soluble lytic murein transglycosylase-like protein